MGATMTRSIFDPTGSDTEHSGSRYLGPDANDISQMPPGVVDGKLSEEERAELEADTDNTPSAALGSTSTDKVRR
jgi:hypothetical protein